MIAPAMPPHAPPRTMRFHNPSLLRNSSRGFSIIELMVAITLSLLVVLGLGTLFVNTSRSNTEMSRTNDLIEDGRVAIQLLTNDLAHAAFWNGYVPQFDSLIFIHAAPIDVPTAIPDPCQDFDTWDQAYITNILGIAVQSNDTLPAGTGCLSPLPKRAGSDVLVARHVALCEPGVGSCEADINGKLYMQSPQCVDEITPYAQDGTANSITMSERSSVTNDIYVGQTVHLTSGQGAGQTAVITAYDGATKVATIAPPWGGDLPNFTTAYNLGEYSLSTFSFPFHKKDCVTAAEKRKFVSSIYYVADIVTNGQTIPTLVRSDFDLANGVLAHQPPVALIEGIEAFRVVLGIDNVSKTGGPVDLAQQIEWTDATIMNTPTNRGDGAPETFVRCTAASACTAEQLTNVVAVKLYLLARSREPTTGYTDSKTYCLGEPADDGSCPAESTVDAANDHYKRHVFTTSVRLANLSGRRDSP